MERLLIDGWYIDEDFAIEKEKFEELFNGKYEYDELINHENCTSAWKSIFDNWKKRGILK